MEGGDALLILVSLGLVLGNAFFVVAEYALVSARRSRIEAMARKGSRNAKGLLESLQDLSPSIAATQVAITMFGIGVGAVTEPFVTGILQGLIGPYVGKALSFTISLLLITFVLVVVGELIPKYVTIQAPEAWALRTHWLLRFLVRFITPLAWLVQKTAELILKPFKIDISKQESEALPRDELMLIVKTGQTEGVFEKMHAEMVTRALRLDTLAATDIMIHRLDIKWIDADTPNDELLIKMAQIPHSRIPVCNGDIDDLLGVVYLHDIIRGHGDPNFSLRECVHEAVVVPENLPMDKIVLRMREEKTQILIVMDEYGGTSGLITLEDVVEEVFGELEDRLESERAPVEVLSGGRISARSDVRFDELLARLEIELPEDETVTDTLATLIIDGIERIPKVGDSVQTALGVLKVENMARSRITRVTLLLDDAWQKTDSKLPKS